MLQLTTITKKFGPYPAAHRQPHHEGHCQYIHGHDFFFDIVFSASTLDKCGFVYDFGQMRTVKDLLSKHFDHTLLLQTDDPLIPVLKTVNTQLKIAEIVVMPSVSAEGMAKFVFHLVDSEVRHATHQRVKVRQVTCHEDEKNSATYTETVL